MATKQKIQPILLTLTVLFFVNFISVQTSPEDSCNTPSKSKAIAFAKMQFQKAYGQVETGQLYAKLLNDSTWFVTSNPDLIEPRKNNRTINFGGVSLKFDKVTCRVIEISGWK